MLVQLPVDSEEETEEDTLVQAKVRSKDPNDANKVQTQFAGKLAFAVFNSGLGKD